MGAIVWVAGPMVGFIGVASGQPGSLEMAIKATYLVKFGQFVEWPARVFPSAASPFILCVAGTHGLGDLIDQAAAGESIAGHPIAVRRVESVGQIVGCEMLFLGNDGQPPVDAALDAVRAEPVLTVTDLPPSAARKGIINFVVQGTHVRFGINNESTNGMKISSQLVALAVNIGLR